MSGEWTKKDHKEHFQRLRRNYLAREAANTPQELLKVLFTSYITKDRVTEWLEGMIFMEERVNLCKATLDLISCS